MPSQTPVTICGAVLADASLEYWDAVVLGCGLAGATFAYGLARRGQRVLVLESGLNTLSAVGTTYPEMSRPFPHALASRLPPETLLHHGRQTAAIDDVSTGRGHRFVPFIGKGVGGSSRLYGMAMERFLHQDFESSSGQHMSADRLGNWPISYDTMLDWYEQAETLFGVRGERDPLTGQGRKQLPPLSPLDAGHEWLYSNLHARGVSPYRLPMACHEVNGCRSCQGHLCQLNCKISSVDACLLPAIATGRTHVAFGCTVVRLEATRNQVASISCEQLGKVYQLRARKFILAMGALYSPALLLRSTSAEWPSGLANSSGWVGRGLMRHGIDLYATRIPRNLLTSTDNRRKTLAFNDFYAGPSGGLGTVQSFGRLPPVGMLSSELAEDLGRKVHHLPRTLRELGARVATPVLQTLESGTLTLAATMEDSADYNNRITPNPASADPAAIRLHYTMTARDRYRMGLFRRQMAKTLKGMPYRRIDQMENNERIAHACGTCRAGLDSTHAVVDADNRAYGLENLWICDASFFPSSGGTNPSLTIAANALRVAAGI